MIICLLKYRLILLLLVLISSCSLDSDNDFSERTKIALRDVGNKLLLSNKDSTSLISPIIALEANKYQLSLSKELSFEPSILVEIIQESFKSSELPEYYRVEVIQCDTYEVAYSYQMSAENESTIIPCAGRNLPTNCYTLEVKFTSENKKLATYKIILYSSIILILLGLGFLILKKTKREITNQEDQTIEKIGSFYFYPEQNKLVKEAQEIALSKKECELLAIFIERPNEIIRRDEITKRVWEDNGVFVGRSLDTYISKLRKKLKSDTSIKLTNVHGVGYKLELNKDN
ncbi:winged helix-turn-helix domain-containing protein [uncultured Winogradskyella sp.]|uniref:winged helix-turn-helix domain-containing protein n=1 Tax=uncultured Winogradskyella sp. TaxID=395353 RepID=UPI0030DB642C